MVEDKKGTVQVKNKAGKLVSVTVTVEKVARREEVATSATLVVGDIRICFVKNGSRVQEKSRELVVRFDSEQTAWMPTHHYNAAIRVAHGILCPSTLSRKTEKSVRPKPAQRALFPDAS